MDTFFAPALKSSLEDLQAEIRYVSLHPIINTLLRSVSGVLAVLNQQRQVISVNETLLRDFGISNVSEVFGLRLGEVVKCRHAEEEPAGCGTTQFCSTCGAAISMMVCLTDRKPCEQKCCIEAINNGEKVDLFFKARTVPITLGSHDFMVIFLVDMTQEQKWASMERVFFHDVSNLLTGLEGLSELLVGDEPENRNAARINQLVMRMSKEIEMQRMLASNKATRYELQNEKILLGQLVKDLHGFFLSHAFSKDKTLFFPQPSGDACIVSDYALVYRILVNMVTNALEASVAHDTVALSVEQTPEKTVFSVHNPECIPLDIKKRIFQRNFSTKKGSGRGIGTYSMKLLGEDLLQGKVSFISTQETGTTFTFVLPRM